MDRLPSDVIIHNIFSRLRVKCLAQLRCVSKQWCNYIDDPYFAIVHGERVVEEPTLIMFHQNPAIPRLPRTLCFHFIESAAILEPNKVPDLEFACKKRVSTCPDYVTRVRHRGSCNGLYYISQDDCKVVFNMTVIHPLKKQCYELPPFPLRLDYFLSRESCALGFDVSANNYKMVCVLLRKMVWSDDPGVVQKYLCTMVHVFGTDSWQEIPQVPFYPVEGKAIFVKGCLYWLASFEDREFEDKGREVIWFDVSKEEFGLINPPETVSYEPTKRKYSRWYDHLVELDGEVGYVCNRTLEMWILKEKEWVLHCRVNEDHLPNQWVKVLGCCNKKGDILFTADVNGRDRYFVYTLKSGIVHDINVVGRRDSRGTGILIYPNSLASIHSINTNCNSLKKRFGLKKCCPRV